MSSPSQTEIRHIRPYVHYNCSCPDVNISLESENEETFNIDSPRIQFSTFSISKLYFCNDCHQIRCPRCVQEEIVSYYCPNCLFEVPTASVKSERNRCARNCFQCPICQNTLSVLPSSEPQPPPSPISPTTVPVPTVSATGAPYYLSCGVCRWDSQEIGMTFEKATGLALQLQRTEDERPDVKEFDHLKDHFEKHMRLNTPSTALPSSLLSIPGMSSFSNRYGGMVSNNQQKSDDIVPYEAVAKVEIESGLVDDLVQLKDVNQITTLTQRINQLSDQPYKVERLQPQRIHLRTKRVKRCRSCRHILIKPEQKAQSTKFKIKLVALNNIPKISIASLPKLILNQRTQIVLKFSNPLDEEISVDLTTQEETNECGKVNILAPHFNITPYDGLWEYEEPDLIASKSRTAPNSIGIYERRGDSTSIIVEITPLAEVEEFRFPLLVTYTCKNNENDGAVTEEKTLDETSSLKATSGDFTADESTRTLSFWTVIGLGPVIKPPSGVSGTLVSGPRSEPSGSKGVTSRGSSGNSNRK
ncbi:dynactin p62 family-domain-containing protein [Rhizophagus diaphanus]|nr:dynactin p62 family-domain-containing protein [Rhizophagus diaphanus] [Rhizophagus sp. MUCL 43196]